MSQFSHSGATLGAGFFGKALSHGDFLWRELPAEFIEGWDRWLQGSMQASKLTLGDFWLPTYLSSPIWRFALDGGLCGPWPWTGVLMPSVDRVGRHFPMTIAFAGPAHTNAPPSLFTQEAWYVELETLALSALEDWFTPDGLMTSIHQLGRPAVLPAPAGWPAALAPAAGPPPRSYWWQRTDANAVPVSFMQLGLPDAGGFAQMLDGAAP